MKWRYERPPFGPIGCVAIFLLSVGLAFLSIIFFVRQGWNEPWMIWLFVIYVIIILGVFLGLGEYRQKKKRNPQSVDLGFDVENVKDRNSGSD